MRRNPTEEERKDVQKLVNEFMAQVGEKFGNEFGFIVILDGQKIQATTMLSNWNGNQSVQLLEKYLILAYAFEVHQGKRSIVNIPPQYADKINIVLNDANFKQFNTDNNNEEKT